MFSGSVLVDAILIVGPGFVALRLFYVFGGQHRRAEWEWVAWSALVGIGIAALTTVLRWVVPPLISVSPAHADAIEVGFRFLVGVVLGLIAAWIWRKARASSHPRAAMLRRYVEDSAWDIALDDAVRGGCGLEVTILQDNVEVSYYGSLSVFGYEKANAQPYVYLVDVYRWEGEEKGGYQRLSRTAGMLFHRDQIARIRVVTPEDEQSTLPTTEPGKT